MVAFNPILWRALDPDGGVHHFPRRPENEAVEVAWATADGRATIHHGDCLDVMRSMPDGSVDAVVTDPPYGLEFMGCAWDTMRDDGKPRVRNEWGDFGSREHARRPEEVAPIRRKKGLAFYDFSLAWAVEALRVAKPGAHLLAFGGTRTFHRLACAIEDAGWEIRDDVSRWFDADERIRLFVASLNAEQRAAFEEVVAPGQTLGWLYGSGFPKSHNGAWGGTALKPAWEPIILARKPLIGTVAANHAAHGTGALNIDACRIAGPKAGGSGQPPLQFGGENHRPFHDNPTPREFDTTQGRWPANVALDDEAARLLDEQSGERRSAGDYPSDGGCRTDGWGSIGTKQGDLYADAGGASRFFFVSHDGSTIKPCAKCLARSVASPSCPSSGPAVSAQSDALTASDRTVPPGTVGPASTGNSEPYTPLRSRALSVGSPDNIGTTPTTPNFCESCGCALRVIDGRISPVVTERAEDASDPVSGTRFWYSAKASRSEREAGLTVAGLRETTVGTLQGGGEGANDPVSERFTKIARNIHPTVKPVDLMRWLVRLVTPLGGTVLDPFLGSGTTLVAALQEGCRAIGIEREAPYVEIAKARVAHEAAQGSLFGAVENVNTAAHDAAKGA